MDTNSRCIRQIFVLFTVGLPCTLCNTETLEESLEETSDSFLSSLIPVLPNPYVPRTVEGKSAVSFTRGVSIFSKIS